MMTSTARRAPKGRLARSHVMDTLLNRWRREITSVARRVGIVSQSHRVIASRGRRTLRKRAQTGSVALIRAARGLCSEKPRGILRPKVERIGRGPQSRSQYSRSLDGIWFRCVNGDHTHAVMTQVGGLQGLRRRPRFLGRYSLSSLHSGFPQSDTVPRAFARAFGHGDPPAYMRSLRRDQKRRGSGL